MVGITPLRRSLPETSDDTNGLAAVEEVGGVIVFPGLEEIDSDGTLSDSGVIRHMFSSSLTTSAIEGRFSVSSWQHLRANDTNCSTHSEG